MEISKAQGQVRTAFLGGFAGQMVSSVVWAISAASTTWLSFRAGVLVLALGGCFIFPLTLALLRALRAPPGLPAKHPMNALAMQVAFTLPLTLPLVYLASYRHHALFYPAFMIALGAHYLPFIFLYGMWQFGVLAGLLLSAGVVLVGKPAPLSFGAWLTALLLLVFAFVGRRVAQASAPTGKG